jgi:hypothetical protein
LKNSQSTQNPPKAKVEEITEEDYVGHIKTIESFERGFMLSQQSKITNYGLIMIDKQDTMLEKQDSIKDVIERGFTGLKEEHIKTRELSKEIFYAEVRELREEIRDLRTTVEETRKKVEKPPKIILGYVY